MPQRTPFLLPIVGDYLRRFFTSFPFGKTKTLLTCECEVSGDADGRALLLNSTLSEQEQTDEKLTQLAKSSINLAASHSG